MEMANPSNSNELCDADEQMKSKRRRKKSIVWEHFTIETIDAECTRACCKQCKKSFAYISRKKPAGTSHLKRHIDLGICPVSRLNQKSNQDSSCTLIFMVTLDESFSNEAMKRNLRSLLFVNNPLVLNGQLLIGSCYARVLGRLAQDALTSMKETVKKVRDSVKYVVTVESHQERFNDLKQQLQVPSTKSLNLDNQTEWNTTYHMLVAASELKEVFSCLDAFDPNYRETLSMEEWKEVEILCIFLKLLFDAANLLVGPTYPTTNVFFDDVWNIQLELTHAAMSEDVFISNLTKPMYERFDKYWKDCSLVLAIAVVMDPRFKMKLVEFSFSRIYGDDGENQMKLVQDGVQELFLDYVVQMLPPPTFVVNGNGMKSDDDILLSTSLESLTIATENRTSFLFAVTLCPRRFDPNGESEFFSITIIGRRQELGGRMRKSTPAELGERGW
ncbi:protein of unknown function DUF4413 [Cynara cardunculus var. scolymus]|uniref:BED-type domain-containing protein n=1 Tax=Cynara cardunculus var. scolymus TaxID=59895 RepID=A0A103XW88_CYNCS|nr:protein of unknown function DUF4413 [Cynara cardunculus var. scolymus]